MRRAVSAVMDLWRLTTAWTWMGGIPMHFAKMYWEMPRFSSSRLGARRDGLVLGWSLCLHLVSYPTHQLLNRPHLPEPLRQLMCRPLSFCHSD